MVQIESLSKKNKNKIKTKNQNKTKTNKIAEENKNRYFFQRRSGWECKREVIEKNRKERR